MWKAGWCVAGLWSPWLICEGSGPRAACAFLAVWAGLSAFTLCMQGEAGTTVLPGCGSLVGQLRALTQTSRHWWGLQSRLWLKTVRWEKAVALTLLPEMSTSSLKWEIAQEASNICFLAHCQTALSNRDRMPATYTIYNFIQSTVKKKSTRQLVKLILIIYFIWNMSTRPWSKYYKWHVSHAFFSPPIGTL